MNKSEQIIEGLKKRAIAEAKAGDMSLFNSIKDDLGLEVRDIGLYKQRTISFILPVNHAITLDQIRAVVPDSIPWLIESWDERYCEKFAGVWNEKNGDIYEVELFMDDVKVVVR